MLRPRDSCKRRHESHLKRHVDFHMWLVATEGDDRSQSMVVEISPRELANHPEWLKHLPSAANDGTFFRVRGWRTCQRNLVTFAAMRGLLVTGTVTLSCLWGAPFFVSHRKASAERTLPRKPDRTSVTKVNGVTAQR
jgi:hypothetical protein